MMKKQTKIILFIVAVAALAGFLQSCSLSAGSGEKADKSFETITAEEAKKIMDEDSAALVLDVRTSGEYEEKHIPGAVNLPNENIGKEEPAELPDKEQTILIYCRSGNRSAQAAEKLSAMGYNRIYDFGGIRDWPYETE